MTKLPENLIHQAARLLKAARHAVVLTGAGISTPSGIPDFRSPGTGEWANIDPIEVISMTAFRRRPEHFYAWFRPLASKMASAQPNPAHLALAELERLGILRAVLTQNIDGLHHRAGSQHVIELHGTLQTLTCPVCQKRHVSDHYFPEFIKNNIIPRCSSCKAILKPDIIFFEEMLPIRSWRAAEELASQADVFLIAGTSLEVVPVNSLPRVALENGASLIINTLSSTYLDNQAEILLNCEISLALPAIVRAILEGN